MGAWGPGPLENDAAWDALLRLAEAAGADRAALVLSALEAVHEAWDVEDACWAVAAATLVAMARNPAYRADDRARIVDHVGRTADVDTFAELVGDRKALRTPAAARSGATALEAVRRSSELATLWAGDAEFTASLDDVAAALAAPTAAWPASADRQGRPIPIRKALPAGTLVGVDLGDGRRGYAVRRDEMWFTVFGVAHPVERPPSSAATVLGSAVAFQMKVNTYDDVPQEWSDYGRVEDERRLPELPLTFHQSAGSHRRPQLIAPGGFDPRPASQEECIGLEPYGIAWRPKTLGERLRCHLDGVPHPETVEKAVRLSRSLFRVVTRDEAAAAAGMRHLAPGGDANSSFPYTSAEVALRLARALGPGRTDLVLAEIDEAALQPGLAHRAAADPDDPDSPAATWARLVGGFALDAVHELRATVEGYEPVGPVVPRYP